MSDKKLLEESTIRRFMQLANIKPIGDGLIAEAAKKGHEETETKAKEATEEKGAEKKAMKGKKPAPKKESLDEMYDEGMNEEGTDMSTGMPVAEGGLEEAEEEGVELEEITYQGKVFYRDPEQFVYTLNDEGEVSEEPVGYWKEKTKTIAFYNKK